MPLNLFNHKSIFSSIIKMSVNFIDYLICIEKLRETTKILFDQSKHALWNSKDYYNRKEIINDDDVLYSLI